MSGGFQPSLGSRTHALVALLVVPGELSNKMKEKEIVVSFPLLSLNSR
jgi:hypothetical protein